MRRVILFNREKPELIYPAAGLFLKLGGSVMPIDFMELSASEFNKKEELYLLGLEPQNDDENTSWVEFQLKHDGQIKLAAKDDQAKHDACLHDLASEGFVLPPEWRVKAMEIANLNFEIPEAERIIRAYKAQLTLNFNTDNHKGADELLFKMISELIFNKQDFEIDALKNFHKKAEEELTSIILRWKLINLRDAAYRAYPFQTAPLIALEEGREINNFLHLPSFIQVLRAKLTKNVNKFMLEYNCRGRYHYLLCGKDQISRCSYSDGISLKAARIKAAHKILF